MRSFWNCVICCWKPRPSSPMVLATGTRASTKASSAVSDDQLPSFTSLRLTEKPDEVMAEDIRALREVGLSALEILDLIHSVALFAWANRLMLNLGEPIFPEDPASEAAGA